MTTTSTWDQIARDLGAQQTYQPRAMRALRTGRPIGRAAHVSAAAPGQTLGPEARSGGPPFVWPFTRIRMAPDDHLEDGEPAADRCPQVSLLRESRRWQRSSASATCAQRQASPGRASTPSRAKTPARDLASRKARATCSSVLARGAGCAWTTGPGGAPSAWSSARNGSSGPSRPGSLHTAGCIAVARRRPVRTAMDLLAAPLAEKDLELAHALMVADASPREASAGPGSYRVAPAGL